MAKIKPIFAWYDLWIGIFIDRLKGVIYILPLPSIGIKVILIPDGYRIEKVKTYWTKSKPETAYISYKIYSDEESQIGTFHTWLGAYKSIIELDRVLRKVKHNNS